MAAIEDVFIRMRDGVRLAARSPSRRRRTRIDSDADAYHLTLDVETTEDGTVR